MGFVRNVADVCVENPARALVTIWVQPTRPLAEALTCMSPGVVVVVSVVVATPAVGVCGPDADTEPSAGVTFVNSTCGAVALETVLPFASLSAAPIVTVEMPSAIVRVALAEQLRLAGEPKTLIDADALSPAEVATIVHG